VLDKATITFADEKRTGLMREDGAGFEQSRSSLGVEYFFNPVKTKESIKQSYSGNTS
jgi:hypothetical protein